MKKVIVIGGGVAGLVAATEAVRRGFKVILIEQRPHLGGRTFSFDDQNDTLDNGQHLLMGCYDYTISWLRSLGQNVTLEKNSNISFIEPGGFVTTLKIPALPSPFHFIFSLMRFEKFSSVEKWRLLTAGIRSHFRRPDNKTLSKILEDWNQSPKVMKYFWEPVCLAVMNVYPKEASADIFFGALRLMFLKSRDASRFILPDKGLSEFLVDPAEAYLKHKRCQILLTKKLRHFNLDEDRVVSIQLKSGEVLEADYYICAIPYWKLQEVIPGSYYSRVLGNSDFSFAPILSVYVWIKSSIDINELFEGKFIGCIDTGIQWVFKKTHNVLEITISAADEWMDRPLKAIEERLMIDLMKLFPQIYESDVLRFKTIKERKATCRFDQGKRPSSVCEVRNLLLAGDWTETYLPGTIESAAKSGYQAVASIL